MKRKVNGKTVQIDAVEAAQIEKEWAENTVKQKAHEAATAYLKGRSEARGSVEKQLEYIVENGIDAFIATDLLIRAANPKPEGNN